MNVRIPKCVYYRMKLFNSVQILKKNGYSKRSLLKLKKILYSVTKAYQIDLSDAFKLIDQLIDHYDSSVKNQLIKELERIIRLIR